MSKFIHDDFLLSNDSAKILYHTYAKDMPIIDYHCHISPKDIAENRKYKNITELWLGGDHYKWRAMRSNGVDEKYITGDALDEEKFSKWADTVPYTLGNPLYHWTHLELERYFGISKLLGPDTREEIWMQCNEMLKSDDLSVREIIKRSKVEVICTTDDPVDDLMYHRKIQGDKSFDVKVLPSFRPDKALNIENKGFVEYVEKLEEASSVDITNLDDLKLALRKRMEFFNEHGCRLSDHAMDPVYFEECDDEKADKTLKKALAGESLARHEVEGYKTNVILFLGREYARLNWTMQLHIGVIRNVNSRMMEKLGPDTGFDCIGDYSFAKGLCSLLDSLDRTNKLPRTILYCINPRDNELLASIIGCFQRDVPCKIQFGSGWWFNDQKDGMIRQMTALANLGLLSRFVGMLTDSRSFLSYTRHEYFRRILCNFLGGQMEAGEIPKDFCLVGKMVQDICYNNAKRYFGF